MPEWPVPTRTERRGVFPEHADRPRPPRTRAAALAYALARLNKWRKDHPA